MERLRSLPREGAGRREPGTALFTAALSLVFALASIGLHDAMTAFVSAHESAAHGGFADAIALTLAWAIVPFAVTLAWLCRPITWLAIPVGVVGAVSSGIAGCLFAWSPRAVVTTAIPSLVILGLGYRQAGGSPKQHGFIPHACHVVWVAAAWLAAASLLDLVLGVFGLDQFKLYNRPGFWVDVKFYLGWSLGLLLSPSPRGSDQA
jgi:hypothetical protein